MEDFIEKLPSVDKIPFQIRALYEAYGYQKFQMVKFETYDLYQKHRNFLDSESILTFTDARGKLMALKPDVTVSIVNNTKSEGASKLFYSENVFRMDKGSKEFREINQIGLEYIGGDAKYAEAEVVLLALKSLAMISDNFVLNVGHISFISGLLNMFGFSESDQKMVFGAIKNKNLNEMDAFLDEKAVSEQNKQLLRKTVNLSCGARDALAELRRLSATDEQSQIVCELEGLYKAVEACGFGDKIRFDMSVINDIDYYNGLIFQGYIPSLPKALLAGGRYDNMMRRFNKPQRALGFAIYAGELERALREDKQFDVDVLLIFGDATADKVAVAVSGLVKKGFKVRAQSEDDGSVKAKKVLRLNAKGEVADA